MSRETAALVDDLRIRGRGTTPDAYWCRQAADTIERQAAQLAARDDVRAGERERCAKVCDAYGKGTQRGTHFAAVIRALPREPEPPAGQRERVGELGDRIARAIAALDEAPDPPSEAASKRQATACFRANLTARTILTEGTEPPQVRTTRSTPPSGGDAAEVVRLTALLEQIEAVASNGYAPDSDASSTALGAYAGALRWIEAAISAALARPAAGEGA